MGRDRELVLSRRRRFLAATLAAVTVEGCTPGATHDGEPAGPPIPPSTSATATPSASASVTAPPSATTSASATASVQLPAPPHPCLSVVPQAAIAITAQVFFQPGESAVPDRAGVILDSVAQAMADSPFIRLEVVGHCDTTESTCPSRRRANAVQQALVARGVDPARLTTRDVLAGEPVVQELGGDRAKNRRVSFVVR